MEIPETNLFGDLLKWFRRRSDFTQERLAHEIGQQSRGNIQAWEASQYLPREREIVLMLARALRLTDSEADRFLLAAHYPQEYHTQGMLASNAEMREQTIKRALGNAIQCYATSNLRLELSRPLLEKNTFLVLPAVATELLQLIHFERTPEVKLIGDYWKRAMDSPPTWCDFTVEAQCLLDYFQSELRGTEIFRPVFDSKSLGAIANQAADAANSLKRVENQLTDLTDLLAARFSTLISSFGNAPDALRGQICDYTRYIGEKTHDFVGRQFVFDALMRFTENQSRGYFFIRGDPGIGKSTLAAQMVKSGGYIHHFNIRSEGINRTETFLRNICAQLIVVHALAHTTLPAGATLDANFLNTLLNETSDKLKPGERVIIVIDALDEVDDTRLPVGANLLYLPLTVPQGIYIVATTRKIPLLLRIECEQDTLDIEHDSQGNIQDIRAYLERVVVQLDIQSYIRAQGIDNELFIEHLQEKSEGNFIYLRYVLPEIEHGAYQDLGLDALPTGLKNYYEDHWRCMRRKGELDDEIWFRYKLPVIMALAVTKAPISLDLIAQYSGVQERPRIREILQEWAQFLHEEQVMYQGEMQRRYGLYHASFYDFIAKREEIADERVSIQGALKKMGNAMLSQWM